MCLRLTLAWWRRDFGCIPKLGSSGHSSGAQPTLHTQLCIAMPLPRNSSSSSQKLPGRGVPARQKRSRHKDSSLLLFLIILRVTTMERIFKFGHFLVPIYNACLLLSHYLVWTQQTKHSAAVSCSPLLAQGCCTWLAKALWKCLNLNKMTVFISN